MARKKISQELDLTPFIGLFAMLVVLLLVTASWSKLYSFKTKFSKSVESLSPSEPEPQKKEVSLKIQIYKKVVLLLEEGPENKKYQIPLSDPINSIALSERIKPWLQRFGSDKQITIESEGQIGYGVLIDIYDVVFGIGMEKIAISTGNLKEET